MNTTRLLRFALGIIIAAIILAIILPFAGIPSSHYLPPAFVYSKAQGHAKGYVTGKYYAETGNPFIVGTDQYFINYAFKAPAPGPRGGVPGPKQLYTGTVRLDQDTYDEYKPANSQNSSQTPAGNVVIPLPPYPIPITYETTYPDINGVSATWGQTYQNGRNIGAGSAVVSGWMLWVVLSIFLGYFVAMGLASLMKSEEL
jgi:hypothetical protein